MIGTTLSHFRILEKIGQGGMGVIYRAVDERLHRQVALKVLPSELVENPDRRLRFLREARSAAAIAHPNIATIFEVDEADGQIFIAMELVEGENLDTHLQRSGALSLPDLLDITLQIAEGLTEAHSNRIAHLDLKPKNIMIGQHGRVKILDFGLSRSLLPAPTATQPQTIATTVSVDLTGEGRIAGTAFYMSPEQAQGKPCDQRSDIFSFGTLLYELFTGKKPFTGENLTATVAKILEFEPPPPSSVRPEIPARLEQIILRCQRKDPAGRYDSAGAILSDLLTTKLDGAGDLRTVDSHSILCCAPAQGDGPQEPGAWAEEARQFGAGMFLLGNVLAIGDRLHIDASLYESVDPSKAISKATAQGDADQIFEMVDDMSAKLLAGRCGGPQARYTRIAAVTTESFAALKSYLEGEREMRRMRRAAAVEAFGQAVEADPAFALAWYRRSVAALWSGQPGIAATAIRHAARHAARLSDRDRRLVEAFEAVLRGANDKAERLYHTFTGTWPDDLEAWYQLAEVQFHHGPQRGRTLADSLPAWERVLFLDPNHVNALVHVGAIAASTGDHKVLELARGRYASAQRDLDDARALNPRMAVETRALLCAVPFLDRSAEELEAIRNELAVIEETPSPATEAAPTWSEPHQGLHPQLRAYLLGLLSIRLGEPQHAEARAAEIGDDDLPGTGHLIRDLTFNLRAHAAAARDRHQEALGLLGRARMESRFDQSFLSPLYSQSYERFTRARLLAHLGRPREALPWYASFGQNSLYDLIYLGPSHLERARIHADLGETDRAIDSYGEFLALWSEADPEMGERVEEAKWRIVELRERSG